VREKWTVSKAQSKKCTWDFGFFIYIRIYGRLESEALHTMIFKAMTRDIRFQEIIFN